MLANIHLITLLRHKRLKSVKKEAKQKIHANIHQNIPMMIINNNKDDLQMLQAIVQNQTECIVLYEETSFKWFQHKRLDVRMRWIVVSLKQDTDNNATLNTLPITHLTLNINDSLLSFQTPNKISQDSRRLRIKPKRTLH